MRSALTRHIGSSIIRHWLTNVLETAVRRTDHLPGGRQLVTLEDAGDHITKLPKADQQLDEWQTAIGCLVGAAEGRDFMMHGRIGMMRAINRDIERVFDPSRKDKHRGKRKLKRDQ